MALGTLPGMLFLLFSFQRTRASTVALVSEKMFHQEMLPGYIHVLKVVNVNLSVFLPHRLLNKTEDRFGLLDCRLPSTDTRFLPLNAEPPKFVDAVIFISPEYSQDYVKTFLSQTEARRVAFVIHNGDAKALPGLLEIRPDAELFTLAPHVQQFVSNRVNRTVQWLLPTRPSSIADRNCSLKQCFKGFSIQVRI